MSKKSFTLIEVLVTVSIISVLSATVVMYLNPVEFLNQGRDSQRIADMERLNTAISLYDLKVRGPMGEENKVYISLPDTAANCPNHISVLPELAPGWSYNCVTATTLQKTDGTGWLPINLNVILGGSTILQLPIDPDNRASEGKFYSYTVSADGYELATTMGSGKFSGRAQTDGGKSDTMYELGTDTNIVAQWLAGLAPAGLASLTLSAGSLSPLFTSDNLSYTASVPYESSSMTMTPTESASGSAIRVNGNLVVSGQPSPPVFLNPGAVNPISISVTPPGGEVINYTVNVTRASSPYLSGLVVKYSKFTSTLLPTFEYNILQYSASTAGNLTFNITSTATGGGTIRLNGDVVASGTPVSKTVASLPAVFNILVSSQVGTDSREYILTITN